MALAFPTSFDKSRRERAHTAPKPPSRPSVILPRLLSCAVLLGSFHSTTTFANHPPHHPSPSPPPFGLSPSPFPILHLSRREQDGGAGGRRRRGDVGGVGRHHAEVRVVRPDGLPRRGARRRRARLPPPLLPVPPLQEHAPGPRPPPAPSPCLRRLILARGVFLTRVSRGESSGAVSVTA